MASKTTKTAKVSKTAVVKRQAHTLAIVYVTIATTLSAGLNAYANAQHAPGLVAGILAAVLGIVVPVLVLLLGAIASKLFRVGFRRLSYVAGGVGVVVLALSVVHCTDAIAMLTASNYVLAAMLAIGIDAGMVVAEIVAATTD